MDAITNKPIELHSILKGFMMLFFWLSQIDPRELIYAYDELLN